MSQEQLLDALKIEVRSLLMSSKTGLAPEQLRRDYMAMVGHSLPLRALGFRNIMDMVVEMTDVIRVGYASDGSMLLRAIADESTRGIEELVARQKTSKTQFPAKKKYHPVVRAPLLLPRRGQPPPSLPAALRSELRQLLASGPLLVSELESRFAKRFGRPLQVTHYGFNSIAEMLRASADIVAVEQSRAGSLLTLKSSEAPTRAGLQAPQNPVPVKIGTNRVTQNIPQSVCVSPLKKLMSPIKMETVKRESIMFEPHGTPLTEKTSSEPKLCSEEKDFEKCIKKLEEELKSKILDCGPAGTVSPELKERLRLLVSQKPEGILVKNLPEAFKKMFGVDLPVTQCGFLSVTDLVSALSDTLYLDLDEGKTNNNWIVMDIKQKEILKQTKLREGSPAPASSQPLDLSGKSYNSGCEVSEWERKEREEHKTTGSDEFEKGDKVVSKTFQQTLAMQQSIASKMDAYIVPPDAVQWGSLRPAAQRKERSFVSVLVEKVVSPSQFYIRFIETQESRALEDMMIEMRGCYSCPEVLDRYHLPGFFVRVGQVCCVAPRGMWMYRVVIHRVVSDLTVEVYYVDFGDVSCVERSRLKFLKSCYSKLPAQAVPSTLTWIKPFQSTWSEAAIKHFQKLCCERPLVAVILKYVKGVLHLFLCDTYTEEDVYIHNVLQILGYAVPCSIRDIAETFRQFNPVSLYLRERALSGQSPSDRPVSESPKEQIFNGSHNRLAHNQQLRPYDREPHGLNSHSSAAWKEELDFQDLPGLEFDPLLDSSCQSQGVNTGNPFSAQLWPDPISSSGWDEGWTPDNSIETTATQATPCSNRDTLEVPAAFTKTSETMAVMGTPLTELHKQADFSCLLKDSGGDTLLPPHTFQQRISGLMFPLFRGDGFNADKCCLPQTSPSAVLGPAARLATASNLLDWYSYEKA
ncbi:tudor domain-containing protein 5 [Amia ocellicauda]|uniref:tudor domain-containing protein 5 n=1 Tax=Amia ocellicauda TaxID=2972642 RepID=UPI003464966D